MDLTCAGLLLGAVFKSVALYSLSNRRKKKVKVGVVSGIKIYPVKSLGGIHLDSVNCTKSGPKHGQITDRHWMVIRSDGVFECAFTDPSLNLIQCTQNGDNIELSAPNMIPLSLPIKPQAGKVIKSVVEKEPIDAMDCGDEAATWIQTFLNKPGHRIVFAGPSLQKRKMRNHRKLEVRQANSEGEMAFAAETPFLLVNEASLEDLNSRLDRPVSMENFRGNIIVAAKEPFEEETWKHVYINDVKMNFVKLCDRCTQTTIHPGAAKKDPNHEPLITLNKYRTRKGYKTGCFGVLAAVEKEGTIQVGDEVYAMLDDSLSISK